MLGMGADQLTLVTSSDFPRAPGVNRVGPLRRILQSAWHGRRILAVCIIAGGVVGLVATIVAPRQYTASAQMEISRATAEVVNVGALSRDIPTGDQEFYQTQYGLLHTQALAERVARDVGVVDDAAFFKLFGKSRSFQDTSNPSDRSRRVEIAGKILLQHVLLAPIHGSSLVEIRATTPSATLSAKLAQTWAEDFIATNLERRVSASSYARQFLETRIDQLRQKLERSERQAVDYAAANGITDLSFGLKSPNGDPTQSRSLLSDDLISSNAAREAAAAERIQANSRLAAADAQPDASSDALGYRAIGQLRKSRADAAAEYARLTAQLPANDPLSKAAQAKVDALDAAIQSERNRVHTSLQQTYQAAASREQALSRRVNNLKGSLAEQRQRSIQYTIYQRDADSTRDLYNALLQRYKEIGVAGEAESNNISIVDKAELPRRPSSPRLLVNLLLFTLAGVVVGAGAIMVLQQIRGGLTSAEGFEEITGLPLLGVLPRLDKQAPVEALGDPRSRFAEAALAMVANLELIDRSGAPATIAVMGSKASQGSSTTAFALARSLARAKRSVALLDLNLRAPSLHILLRQPNVLGVSELLTSKEDLDRVLRGTEIDGLSAITAGAPVSNPADLLIGPGLLQAIKLLRDRFDHVIVDCAPVLDLADGPLVASAVDGVIFVVAARSGPARQIHSALARLHDARVLGGILNLHEAHR
jgi:capsular exopolysaccharide synthesis family protein